MLTSFFKKLTGDKFLFLIIGVCLSLGAKLNAQEIEWQNTIGGNGSDYLFSIRQTFDGGYILGGCSSSNISGDKTENNIDTTFITNDYWIIKTNSFGTILWQNTIGGSRNDLLRSIQQTSDHGYILGGISNSNISGDKTENNIDTSYLITYDYWIVKTDSNGNILWQNTIGGNAQDMLRSIQQTTDGGYILSGESYSNISGDKTESMNGGPDYWIVKTDSIGNILWQNTIGGSVSDLEPSIQQTKDGGYILNGHSSSDSSGDKTENSNGAADCWILKLDTAGGILWQNTIGGSFTEMRFSVQQTKDNGYILAGSSYSNISGDKTENCFGGLDYWVIKIDTNGNLQWQNTIGGYGDDQVESIQETKDGGYILGGFSESNESGNKTENSNGFNDYWIVKIDSTGNLQWQNTIGGNGGEFLFDVKQTSDNGYILGGYSGSNISGDKTENIMGSFDYWILKLTDQYNLITGKTFADLNSNSTQDIGEFSIPNKAITEINTNRFAFTQPNGFYSVAVLDSGNFSVSPSPINYYSAVPVSHAATFTGINQTDSLNDFAFQPLGTFNDLCVTLTPLGAFRPGFNASYMINYENVGTTTLSPTITLYQNNLLSYVGSTVAPTATSTDSVQWSGLPVLSPFQSGSILVTLNVSAAAVIGSNIYSQCIIEPLANDYNVYCNYAGATSVVTGSVDPNDILVSEDTLTTTQLATQPFLDYTIRFQNTGNDTAFTVKIINPIDTARLNLQTIELLNSSHPVNAKWIPYNKNMEFLFENILLPDSNINEPQSHGFVTYRIKPKTTLLAGDSITNKAYIYFDFNAPVETNTAITCIVLPTSIKELAKGSGQLAIFPNPAKDELNIQINTSKANNLITVSIFDVLGNTVLSKQSATPNCKLPTAHFSKGIYFVEVKTGKEVYRSKFVKE
ncbi:MAG: T9SS type A sorting domain-containing protein [Bacteroidetes bacterium]|nr:T9SS type A sorting domain-containing protein [Bacteroidota bacterium]